MWSVADRTEFTLKRRESIERQYEAIFSYLFKNHADIFTPERYTLDDFKWALSTIWSRTFSLAKDTGGLVPLADFFNAKQGMPR